MAYCVLSKHPLVLTAPFSAITYREPAPKPEIPWAAGFPFVHLLIHNLRKVAKQDFCLGAVIATLQPMRGAGDGTQVQTDSPYGSASWGPQAAQPREVFNYVIGLHGRKHTF